MITDSAVGGKLALGFRRFSFQGEKKAPKRNA